MILLRGVTMQPFTFQKAKPVWLAGRRQEMNLSVVFRATVPGGQARLCVAGHSDYEVVVNGRFFSQGPARAGHGWFRVDDLDLSSALTDDQNVVCILAAGYNVNSYYLTHQEPFICAEIERGGEILFATGSDIPFACSLYTDRVQKVQRYSFQRPFVECYRHGRDYDRVFTDPAYTAPAVVPDVSDEKRFLLRETLQSDYEVRAAQRLLAVGTADPATEPTGWDNWDDRGYSGVNGTTIKGYYPQELEICSVRELYGYAFTITKRPEQPFAVTELPKNGFALYDMGRNTTGFIRLRVRVQQDTVLWVIFNETLHGDLPDPGHEACEVRWELQGGRSYELFSFEPYTYRYLQVFSAGGEATVEQLSQYAEHYPAAGLLSPLRIRDEALRMIYDAAVETFRQNAVDIFMDCPSRERAGWLCDSFFTARTERALTGGSKIEKAFLENFILPERIPYLPAGMLPQCYPAEEPGGGYIPNWAMWYGIELHEYLQRSGDRTFIAQAKPRMMQLVAFLSKFENEYGLLEKLESWVFVEWSRANDFVQDVNYPSNMLYALFLEAMGSLYDEPALQEKADRLRETIRTFSFDGEFFVDNAVRKDGRLVATRNRTETCQYYAFFTNTATPQTFPALFAKMKNAFGPDRDDKTQYPDIYVSNAFIGNYLRLEILFRNKAYAQVLEEIRKFFLPMAQQTGTLWENMTDFASCCHGFASHVAYWLHGIRDAGVEF